MDPQLNTPSTEPIDSFAATLFDSFNREQWSQLVNHTQAPLNEAEIVQLRGLGDPLDLEEVETIYVPLSRLLNLYASNIARLHRTTQTFFGHSGSKTPFVIGIAGSVAVGKSTISRLLRELLARWDDTPKVALITTDGFLFPNAELEARKIMSRKGFPESYDRKALMRFISDVKSGVPVVSAPLYSHEVYNIVPDQYQIVENPDILIIEGLNVLQPPRERGYVAVSDLFDFSIYVDAEITNIAAWYEDRFLRLCETTFRNEDSYFHQYASLSAQEARELAASIWEKINAPNLYNNILPTRPRAKLILRKDSNHRVSSIFLRKL